MTRDMQTTLSQPDPEGPSPATMLFPKRITRNIGCHTDIAEAANT